MPSQPTHRLALTALAVAFVLAGCGNNDPLDPTDPSGSGLCASYVGDLHGASATARIVLESGFTTTYISGDITSGVAYYTFLGELLGTDPYTGAPTSNVAYVDVLDHSTGERFRAEIDLFVDHFMFIANPFEGLYTTEYRFDCQ